MGTSLAIHFRQSDIDRVLGVRSLKLTMQGSSSHEQVFVLEEALKQRRPKRIVWQMDDWIFVDSPEIESDVYLPSGLYRQDLRGLAGYLFSGAMARESALMLLRAIPGLAPAADRLAKFTIGNVDDINTLAPGTDPKVSATQTSQRQGQPATIARTVATGSDSGAMTAATTPRTVVRATTGSASRFAGIATRLTLPLIA